MASHIILKTAYKTIVRHDRQTIVNF